jgi:hypothetical protein
MNPINDYQLLKKSNFRLDHITLLGFIALFISGEVPFKPFSNMFLPTAS